MIQKQIILILTLMLILNLGVSKTIKAQAAELMQTEQSENTEKPIIDKMPEFPGGDLALRRYIARNLKYPKLAGEQKIIGKVYVKFVVTSQGYVEQVQIARGVHPLLDDAGMEVIKSLPRWKPGESKGEKVDVWYTVPINFEVKGQSVKKKKKETKNKTTKDTDDWY